MGRPRKVKTAPILRTKEVIDQEYGQHAAQAGHKAGLILELEAQIAMLHGQIEEHLQTQAKLRKEHFAMPAASAVAAVPPPATTPMQTQASA